MKRLCVFGAFAAFASMSVPAQARESVTLYVACMTHYGDNDRPNDVTPVAKVTWPSALGTLLQINSAYFGVMRTRGERFYKAQCWSGDTAEQAANHMNDWEEMSGYGTRPRREQPLDDIFPAMFDRSFSDLSRSRDGPSRSDYSAVAAASAVDAAANAKIERERQRERERTESRAGSGPPQQLEITAGPVAPTAAELAAERHRAVEERNLAAQAKYEAELAEQKRKVAEYEQAQRDYEALKAEQRAAAETVLADHQRQMEAHAQEVRMADLANLEYKKSLAKPAGVSSVYMGFTGNDCGSARLSATHGAGTDSGTQFKEVESEMVGGHCLVRGWWWSTQKGGASRQ